jgi:hypothetical protein
MLARGYRRMAAGVHSTGERQAVPVAADVATTPANHSTAPARSRRSAPPARTIAARSGGGSALTSISAIAIIIQEGGAASVLLQTIGSGAASEQKPVASSTMPGAADTDAWAPDKRYL